MTVPYSPEPYAQGDGSRFEWQNCVLATSTMLMDRMTVGGVRVPAWRLRQITGDYSGGVTYDQAADAVDTASHGRAKPTPRYRLSRNAVRDYAAAGYSFGISIDCSGTIGTIYRTNWFTGGHTVYVNAYRWNSNLNRSEYLVEDPGTTSAGYMWWPASLLYHAAELRGGGVIHILLGRDTEGTSRTAREIGRLRAKPTRASTDKGPVVVGKTYTVVSTTNGGDWTRPDGTDANGWHRVKTGLLSYAYIRGEVLR